MSAASIVGPLRSSPVASVASSLADIQSRLRQAVVTGDVTDVVPLLAGGRDAAWRLAIHQRHYDTSLVTTLLRKFPATIWLVGTPCVTEAARAFVHERPPRAPCLAEYGADFPEFLSTRSTRDRLPYLHAFAALEWHLGHVAVAIDRPPISRACLSAIGAEALMDARLALQPGLRYLRAAWPVDDLMTLHLTGTAPDRWGMAPTDVWIEVRGARGEFRIDRLTSGDYVFRRAIQEGQSLDDAAAGALEAAADFDPGAALARLLDVGLVTAIADRPRSGEAR